MLNYIILLISFVMLIKGADIFVDKATIIANRFKVPKFIIGMTIVAIGTSLPELSVSVQSSLLGLNDMCVANVVGSNIFNLLMITGTIAMFAVIKIDNFKDIFRTLYVYLILFIFSLDRQLSFFNGIVILFVFADYIMTMIKAKNNIEESSDETIINESLIKTILIGIVGLIGIVLGGNLVVNSARAIAASLGMSENLIGLTVVALGTSLPEYVTSIVAARKGEMDMAIGNVLGSNIFNILLVLGIASVLSPISITAFTFIDIIFMITTMIVFIMSIANKRISKINGVIFILLYISYIGYTIIR
jgi:cation:H+ antiporter